MSKELAAAWANRLLENVDSSSGAIGTAVNNAVAQLAPVIANTPADATTRARWLERLWEAYDAGDWRSAPTRAYAASFAARLHA